MRSILSCQSSSLRCAVRNLERDGVFSLTSPAGGRQLRTNSPVKATSTCFKGSRRRVHTVVAQESKSGMSARKVDIDAVRSDWKQRGFSFGVFVDPPGQVWPDFTHRTDELVMLTKGEFELTFNGTSIRPNVGEEIMIPARAMHTVENVGSCTNEWLYGYKQRFIEGIEKLKHPMMSYRNTTDLPFPSEDCFVGIWSL